MEVVLLLLIEHILSVFVFDLSLVVLLEVLPEASELDEGHKRVFHLPLVLICAVGGVFLFEVLVVHQPQPQTHVYRQRIQHHGVLSQLVELPLGAFQNRIHPQSKLQLPHIQTLYPALQKVILAALSEFETLWLRQHRLGLRLNLHLSPAHRVQDVIGD